jgi:hypothetical protein
LLSVTAVDGGVDRVCGLSDDDDDDGIQELGLSVPGGGGGLT